MTKDLEIQEKERLHRELTGILEKQPGPEVEVGNYPSLLFEAVVTMGQDLDKNLVSRY